ncbi:MAG: rod shape-determining protein [Campylobacteraceae bacterium 4484_4]|nr:MAG: rod shape-determining protein [Campylobacteraceae bacterium 4484_4]
MLLNKFFGLFSNDLSIDLGTANTIVLAKGEGIVINEPSVVAVQKTRSGKNKILAVGKEAKEMLGKTPENIQAIRPLKEGVIADFEITEKMIQYFIQKTHNRKSFIRPRIIICVPYGLTQVERKAVKESAFNAGARDVILVEEPKAAAIGAGLPIQDPKGNLVIDIGGGTTEIGVISLGGLVRSKSIRIGGDKFDQAIIDYIKQKFNLVIGERTAEEVKIEIGSAIALDEELSLSIKGRDQITGLLHRQEITSQDIREAITEPLREIGNALKEVLEVVPPDLASDIVENGIVLTGGGSLIRGLDNYLSQLVQLPVFICEEPLLAVAKGTGKMLEEIDLLNQISQNE